MKLDFNETNILVQVLGELERNPKATINKMALISNLYLLRQNTDERYKSLRSSISSLALKIENLSERDINKVREDKENNLINATICYSLPES